MIFYLVVNWSNTFNARGDEMVTEAEMHVVAIVEGGHRRAPRWLSLPVSRSYTVADGSTFPYDDDSASSVASGDCLGDDSRHYWTSYAHWCQLWADDGVNRVAEMTDADASQMYR